MAAMVSQRSYVLTPPAGAGTALASNETSAALAFRVAFGVSGCSWKSLFCSEDAHGLKEIQTKPTLDNTCSKQQHLHVAPSTWVRPGPPQCSSAEALGPFQQEPLASHYLGNPRPQMTQEASIRKDQPCTPSAGSAGGRRWRWERAGPALQNSLRCCRHRACR